MERTAVEIKKLSIKNTLDEVSFKAYAGQIVGILTKNIDTSNILFDALCGKIKYDGKILYFNHNIKKERKYLLNFVGFMPYYQKTFPKKTISDYFLYSSSFYQGDFKQNIASYLNLFNLNPNQAMESLNYEQSAIISFIDSIFFNPEVLILNTPFKDISPSTIQKMTRILSDFRQNGYCVIIIQSSLDGILICDKTYIVDNQSIIEYDDYKKVRNYKKVYLELCNENDLSLILGTTSNIIYQHDLKLCFIYKHDIADLLKMLNKLKINDLKIEDPSLNEVLNDIQK